MEKVGHVMKNENIVEKGHKMRVEKGFGKEDGELEGKYVAN